MTRIYQTSTTCRCYFQNKLCFPCLQNAEQPTSCDLLEQNLAVWAGTLQGLSPAKGGDRWLAAQADPWASSTGGQGQHVEHMCLPRHLAVVPRRPVPSLSSHPHPSDSRAVAVTAPITLCCPGHPVSSVYFDYNLCRLLIKQGEERRRNKFEVVKNAARGRQ